MTSISQEGLKGRKKKQETNPGIDWNLGSMSALAKSTQIRQLASKYQHFSPVSKNVAHVCRWYQAAASQATVSRRASGGKNVIVVGGGGGGESVNSRSGKLVPFLSGNSPRPAFLPEYGGLGGTGGPSNLPTESEKDEAPSLTLSRLQLLGVGLTFSTQRHHKSLNRLWDNTRQHGEHSGILHISDGRCENWTK